MNLYLLKSLVFFYYFFSSYDSFNSGKIENLLNLAVYSDISYYFYYKSTT
jgi:hypothetical protein